MSEAEYLNILDSMRRHLKSLKTRNEKVLSKTEMSEFFISHILNVNKINEEVLVMIEDLVRQLKEKLCEE